MSDNHQNTNASEDQAQLDLDDKLKRLKQQGILTLSCLGLFWVLSITILVLGPLGLETIALTIELFWIAVGVGVIGIVSGIYLFTNTRQTAISSWHLPRWIQITRYAALLMAIPALLLLVLSLLIFLLLAASLQNDPGAFS